MTPASIRKWRECIGKTSIPADNPQEESGNWMPDAAWPWQPDPIAHPLSGEQSGETRASMQAPPGSIWLIGAYPSQTDSPACTMPPPASRQPVIETEGFLPLARNTDQEAPACAMPLPLNWQVSPDPVLGSTQGGDWVTGILENPGVLQGGASAHEDSLAATTFADWRILLETNQAPNAILIAAGAQADASCLAAGVPGSGIDVTMAIGS